MSEILPLIALSASMFAFGMLIGALITYRVTKEPARPLHLTINQPAHMPGTSFVTAAEGQSRAEAIQAMRERTHEEAEAAAKARQDEIDRAREEMPGAQLFRRSADPLMQDILLDIGTEE